MRVPLRVHLPASSRWWHLVGARSLPGKKLRCKLPGLRALQLLELHCSASRRGEAGIQPPRPPPR